MNMKKKIILTVSRVFPVTHSRRGEPTEFYSKLKFGQKIHTIRKNYNLWALNAEKMQRGDYYLSIRQWSDKPYRSPQKEVLHSHTPIGVQPITLTYHADNDTITANIDGREWLDADCYTLAKNDGLSTEDFKEWFFGRDRKKDMSFQGVIIHFTNFRY